MTERSYDWWAERLELDEVKYSNPGAREAMFKCPVHGGGSFHVEERGGRTLVHCFGCQATFAELEAAALEGGEAMGGSALEAEAAEESETSGDDVTTGPRVVLGRTGGRAAAISTRTTTTARPRSTTSASVTSVDPLEWAATRSGMDKATLMALGLPIEARGNRVAFTFGPGVEKLRGPGEGGGKRKDILWVGGYTPPLWPVPDKPDPEIVICEGEFDALVLRAAGYDAYSITGGAGNVPETPAFRVLAELGVERIRVLFDEDDAGRKGRDAVLDEIRAVDTLDAMPSRVAGVLPLMGEKDARDVAQRVGAANVRIEDADEDDDPQPLADVPVTKPAELLLGFLHPSEHTILYGDGGTGKGVIAAWWVANLIAGTLPDGSTGPGKHVLIVDYEAHAQHEWRPRVAAFLKTLKAEARLKTHAHIVQPQGKPIWELQDWLKDRARMIGADYIVIDSVTYACIKDAEVSETAIRYSGAVARLGLPVLSIAHVTKADANPKHPFGSVYWSNGARVTYAVSRLPPGKSDSPRQLANYKSNQRSEKDPQRIDWDWVSRDGPPDELKFTDIKLSDHEMISNEIGRFRAAVGRYPTPAEIAAALPSIKAETIRSSLSRTRKQDAENEALPKVRIGKKATGATP